VISSVGAVMGLVPISRASILAVSPPLGQVAMEKRRASVLLLTQFFPPETGAAQNRLACLVEHLTAAGAHVTVLTAMPNYPAGRVFAGFRGRWFVRERHGSADVIRTWIWCPRRRSVFWRGLGFLSFACSALLTGLTRIRRFDILVWESPPLPLGITAWLLTRLRRARLVTNVSDLWTQSLLDLGIIREGIVAKTFARLERFLYRSSSLVSGQTRHIVAVIGQVCPSIPTYHWPNGADLPPPGTIEMTDENPRPEWSTDRHDFVVGYAGLIGHSQGLEIVVETAQLLRDESVTFVLVGDGPERESLLGHVREHRLPNIIWRPPVPHDEMPGIWRGFDCALVCLRRGRAFRGAVPSKLYEAMGAGLPVLLAIEGEAAEIVREADCGVVVKSEEPTALAAAIRSLRGSVEERRRLGDNGRRAATGRFNRSKLTRQFAESLLKVHEKS
jgi:glycosyltransferase involved in cell wall biosynthesis